MIVIMFNASEFTVPGKAMVAHVIDVPFKVNFLVPGGADHREEGGVAACPEGRIALPEVLDVVVETLQTVHFRRVFTDDSGNDSVVHTEFTHYVFPFLLMSEL
jgi:hypothetical protein